MVCPYNNTFVRRQAIFSILLVVLLCTCTRSAVAQDNGDSDLSVEDLAPDALRERASRRKKYGVVIEPVVDTDDDDDDVIGRNTFDEEADAEDASIGNDHAANDVVPPQGDQRASTHPETANSRGGGSGTSSSSRKEQHRRRREEYYGSSSGSSSPPSSSSKVPSSTFEVKPKEPVLPQVESLYDEVRFFTELFANATIVTSTKSDKMVDEIDQFEAEAVAALPLPLVPGTTVQQAHTCVTKARKAVPALLATLDARPRAAATNGAKKSAKPASTTDNEKAELRARELLQLLDGAVVPELSQTVLEHRRMHRALAMAALSSSAASSGLVMGQLQAVEASLDAMRSEDDGGAKDVGRRARRNAIKAAHKTLKATVESMSDARKAAQRAVAARGATASGAAMGVKVLTSLAFQNALARHPPTSLGSSSTFTRPMPLRLFGFTASELSMAFVVVCGPFQVLQLVLWLLPVVRRLASLTPAQRVVGPGGRRLGTEARSAQGRRPGAASPLRRMAVHFAGLVLLNVVCIVAVLYGLPHLSLPAFAHVTPHTIAFVARYGLSPSLQVISGGFLAASILAQAALAV